jgi:hypothetical protein
MAMLLDLSNAHVLPDILAGLGMVAIVLCCSQGLLAAEHSQMLTIPNALLVLLTAALVAQSKCHVRLQTKPL